MSVAKSDMSALPMRSGTILNTYVLMALGSFYMCLLVFEFGLRTTYLRSMPQDLFFQLDGIYRMSIGQKIYVDFSAILGLLSYLVPLQFVHWTGDPVLSINYTSGLIIALAFPVVAYLTSTRLPPLFGLVFGIWIGLALAARMNLGDDATDVTVAMNYNRQGDAALALALLMFRPPRTGGPATALLEGLLYAVLTGFMLYTKVTFGLVALAFAPVVFWPQRHPLAALAAFVLAFGLIVLAVEFGYGTRFLWLQPVRMALASGGPLSETIAGDIHALLENLPELLVCTLVPAWFLWRERRLTKLTMLFFVMVAGASAALITQNGQRYDLFLPSILFFVAAPPADPAAEGRARWRDGLALVAIAVLALESGPQVINLMYAGYRSIALPPMVADNDVLQRIVIRPENQEDREAPRLAAILAGQVSAVDAFAMGRDFRPAHPFDKLTMLEYRDYLTDGMRAARQGCDPASRILTLDIGNPFPLLLGWPAGGVMLVIHPDRILSQRAHPPDAEMFRDIDCVLVPKLPVTPEARDFMFDVYGAYLASRFAPAHETTLWKVLKRKSPGQAG